MSYAEGLWLKVRRSENHSHASEFEMELVSCRLQKERGHFEPLRKFINSLVIVRKDKKPPRVIEDSNGFRRGLSLTLASTRETPFSFS